MHRCQVDRYLTDTSNHETLWPSEAAQRLADVFRIYGSIKDTAWEIAQMHGLSVGEHANYLRAARVFLARYAHLHIEDEEFMEVERLTQETSRWLKAERGPGPGANEPMDREPDTLGE